MGVLVERQAEPGNQKRNGQDDADVEQIDETVEWVPCCVFDAVVAAESCATGHGSVTGGIGGLSCVVLGTRAESTCGIGEGIWP